MDDKPIYKMQGEVFFGPNSAETHEGVTEIVFSAWPMEKRPIEAVVDADDYAQLWVIGDLGGVEL